jgi:tetratricopeptide (TPR) repeat protein
MTFHIARLARPMPTPQFIVRICSHLIIVVVLLLGGGQAQAVADESMTEAARAQFAHGVELADKGDYQGALQAFSDAYTASPLFAVLYNIGQAQVALGRPLEAAATLSRYLREGQDSVPAERRRQVEDQLKLLESFLVALDLSTAPASVAISVDGREIGRTPLVEPVRLTAGTHKITATLDETTPASSATVPPADCPAAPPPVGDLARPTMKPMADHNGFRAALPFTLLGAGVALGAGALGVYLWKRGQYQQWQSSETILKDQTPGSASYQARAADNERMAASLTTANHTIVGLSIAGGALVAVGASLYLFDLASARRSTNLTVAWAGGSSVAAGWRCSW